MHTSPDGTDTNIISRISQLRKRIGISEEISTFSAGDGISLNEKDSKYLVGREINSPSGKPPREWIDWGKDDPGPIKTTSVL